MYGVKINAKNEGLIDGNISTVGDLLVTLDWLSLHESRGTVYVVARVSPTKRDDSDPLFLAVSASVMYAAIGTDREPSAVSDARVVNGDLYLGLRHEADRGID